MIRKTRCLAGSRSTHHALGAIPGRWIVVFLLVLGGSIAQPTSAAPTDEQRALLRESLAAARDAGRKYRAGQYDASARQVVVAIEVLDQALRDAEADVFTTAKPLVDLIERTHTLLQLEGVVLPPFERPEHGKQWTVYAAPPADTDSAPMLAAAEANVPSTPTGPSSPPPKTGTPETAEPVSFARQVAPLLVENCGGCHLDAMRIRGGLNLNTLAGLMRGGDSGEVIMPGDGEGSLLVRKLRGSEGARMPAGGRPPLAEEAIQLISMWIDQGAQVEEGTADQPLGVMVAESWAASATQDELSQRRKEIALRNWVLGASGDERDPAVQIETESTFVLGDVSRSQAQAAANAAEKALEKARTMIPSPRGNAGRESADLRGRVTLFLFPRRYDYSEFAKMVEARDIPSDWDAHWSYDGIDAYVAMVVGEEEDENEQDPRSRLLGPIASLLVASRGQSPRWFREGMGRAVAAKLGGREFDAARQWDAALRQAVTVIKEPKELIDQRLPPEQADLIGYGLAQVMIDRRSRKQLDLLLRQLDEGAEFDQAFVAAFKMPLENFITMWSAWYQRR